MDDKSKKPLSLKQRIASELIPFGSFMLLVVLAIGLSPYLREYKAELETPYKQRLIADARERGKFSSFPIDDGLLVKVDGIVTREGAVILEKALQWPTLVAYLFIFALYVVFAGYWKRTVKLESEEATSKSGLRQEGVVEEFLRISNTVRRDAERQFLQARLMLTIGILVAIAGVLIFGTILDQTSDRKESRNLRDSIVPSSATQTAPVPGSEAGDKSYAAESEQTWLERMARDQSIDEKKLVAMLNYREKTKQIDKVAPEPETSSKLLRNMLPALRSFALFLAIEAIAWFLLRQYRFAIADFKQIYRMYLRRESLLVAWQMSQTEDAKESGVTLAVIAAMLQEDQEARLLKDESTASVQEIAATDEKNPITGLVQAAIGNWRSK